MREILDNFKNEALDFLRHKKNLINLLLLGILILGIPLGVELLRRQQILKSRADIEPIVFVESNDLFQKDGKWFTKKPQISLQITSPLGPPAPPPTPTPPPPSTPTPTPTSTPTSPPNYGSRIIAYEAFSFKIGTQQKVTQSLISDNSTTFSRTCDVGATDVNWSACNAAGWTVGTISAPDGSGAKIISYGAFNFTISTTIGTQQKITQKITQSLLTDNGTTFARTCDVGATDVEWSACNAKGWQKSTISIPTNITNPSSSPNYGSRIIAYEAFSFKIGTQQKVTQSLISDNSTTFSRTCDVGATDVEWSACNAKGWSVSTIGIPTNITPPPTSPPNYGSKIISYGAFNFTIGAQQKITQSLLTDNGTTFARTCDVGATDVEWSACNAKGWQKSTISIPTNIKK